jgi:hypothetical protein
MEVDCMAKTQPLFVVRAANRKTGDDAELRIDARDEDAAMAAEMEHRRMMRPIT